MVADPNNKDPDAQRMELLVMASEAEWARDLLRRGIPEMAGAYALPSGGFEVVPIGSTSSTPREAGGPPPLPEWFFRQQASPAIGSKPAGAPAAAPSPRLAVARPVAPLQLATQPGQSKTFTITLIILCLLFLLTVVVMVLGVMYLPNTVTQ